MKVSGEYRSPRARGSDDELLTVEQVANRCQVSKALVYRWLKDQELSKAHLPARKTRIWRSDLEAMLRGELQ